jgi:mRNA (guanine-N7-)-methyltransferase
VKHSILKQACIGFTNTQTNNKVNNMLLLDVGVGRGGDILKWKKCGIQKVIGFDPNETSIEDANKRLVQLDTDLDYTFHCCQNISDLQLTPSSCSIVSCQFAIHYFFSNLETLHTMLLNVKRLLKKNGYFVGTFMNADKINEVLVNDTYMNNAMMIRCINRTNTHIGETIHVHLSGTLYFAEDCVSIEYMVYPEVLVNECKRVGLRLFKMTSFEDHFKDMGSINNIYMDVDHKICSFMYSSFIFVNN